MKIKHFYLPKANIEWISTLRMEIGEIWAVVVLFFKFHVLFPVRV